MRIIIDADGCPVVDITIEIAQKFHLECIIVCDTSHQFKKENVKTITVSKGADSADYKIVNIAIPSDIVVTQDYGLAAMCLSKNVFAINQNGLIYNKENIDTLLMQRYNCKKMIKAGHRVKGPRKREKTNDTEYIFSLEKLIQDNTK